MLRGVLAKPELSAPKRIRDAVLDHLVKTGRVGGPAPASDPMAVASAVVAAPGATVAMAAKFETEQGKADYKKRKWIAEPPNGWIKNVLGFRQFSMRGLKKAQAEFKLVCLALNLRRMGAMQAS